MSMRKTYVKPEEFDDDLPIREKAKRHLETWSKKRLVDQLSFSAKDGWIEKWAEEHDKESKRD